MARIRISTQAIGYVNEMDGVVIADYARRSLLLTTRRRSFLIRNVKSVLTLG